MSRDRSDERLRDAFTLPRDRAPASSDCPSDEEIWEAGRGELPRGRIDSVLEHLGGCPACSESFRIARALEGERAAAQRVGSGPPRAWLGLAAAAVLIVGLIWLFPRVAEGPGVPVDEFRAAASVEVRSAIDAGAVLSREAFVLRWTGPPAGTLYTVELATEQLELIHRASEIDGTEYRVPPAVLDGLAPGTKLLWRVDAVLPDASRLSSTVFRATVE